VVHLASEFGRLGAPADQPAVELSMSDEPVVQLASEFAVLDAPELHSVAEFSAIDPAITVGASNQTLVEVLAAERGAPEAGAVAELVLGPLAEPVDLEALIAEVSALDVGAGISAPAETAEIETPTGPVFKLTNPTPEDFTLPAEETDETADESLHSLSLGDEGVNELPLLSAIVSESLDVDAEAVALASEVPSGPVFQLTNPTRDDFPEPLDLDEDLVGDGGLADQPLGESDYPILVAFAALPDVVAEPVPAPARVPPSLVALERLLKRVERRRLHLMSESVA